MEKITESDFAERPGLNGQFLIMLKKMNELADENLNLRAELNYAKDEIEFIKNGFIVKRDD